MTLAALALLVAMGDDPSRAAAPVHVAAYPYQGDARIMEAYVEKMFRPAAGLVGVKAGRYRTPFGRRAALDAGVTCSFRFQP